MKKVPKAIKDFCDKEKLLRLGYVDSKGNPHVVPLWFARVKGDHWFRLNPEGGTWWEY